VLLSCSSSLVSRADFDDNRNNVTPASFISTVIETNLTEVLQALGDPVRLAIVRGLAAETRPRACGTFAYLGVSPSTLSHHFKVLREAGVIATRADGHQRLNSLARESLDAHYPGLLDSVLAAAAA
jgi:DNA-binding transcriptional ArsR family regulator